MSELSIAVCIPTTGRPTVLTETLRDLAALTRQPDRVIVCPAKAGDLDEAAIADLPIKVEIVHGNTGLSAQRNTLLRAAGASIELVLFIDDDFLLAPSYLTEMERLFVREPQCVVATGLVLADGATNSGYAVEEGRRIIAADRSTSTAVVPAYNAYGCNMAIRWSRLRDTSCTFDENLPLYGWAEDVDFSRQAAVYGSILKVDSMRGVHLAEKKGRTSGVRFGYSQIANPIYLVRKGTNSISGGVRKGIANVLANMIGAVRNNEPYVDRRGRLRGNFHALRDAVFGRSSPNRIFDF